MAEGDKAIEGTDAIRCASWARSASRSTRKPGVVLQQDRQRKVPDRRYRWQTETGGFMITPLPGATELKAGSATRPFFGVQPALVDNVGTPQEGACEGNW